MKVLIRILWFAAITLGCLADDSQDQSDDDNVEKTAVAGFRDFVEAMTGRNAIDYNGYGNYCGIGGSGTPVDGVDTCCQIHDKCYENSRTGDCKNEVKAYIYVAPYSYNASPGSIQCTEGKGFISGILKNLSDAKYKCGRAICSCDADAAKCFGRNTYNPKNKKHIITAG